MLQSFIRFPELAEFSEFLLHLEKTPIRQNLITHQWIFPFVDKRFIKFSESYKSLKHE